LLRHLPEIVRWAEIVHLTAVYNFTTFPALMACSAIGRPVVWSPRGAFQRWEGSTKRGLKGIWESAARVAAPKRLTLHVTSEDEARQTAARFPGATVAVIPNGIDRPAQKSRSESSTLRLLFLGRLHPIKGLENLLEACNRLADWPRDWVLTIAGDGAADYRAHLETMAETARLAHRIRFVGHASEAEKTELFAESDVVVVPSHSENFGIVVTEALSHGVPVIAAKGTPWARLEGMNCGLWVSNDPRSLAAAIRKMDTLPRHAMGERGRLWMQQEFSWAHVASATLDLYRQAVS
jgi:glycosyltransferase involved in cell wall biosynthesis